MSFKAAAWAIEQSVTTTATQKLVLIALADCHNGHTKRCDPSVARLANICHISERTVVRTIRDLEELGLVEKRSRVNKDGQSMTNFYRFPPLDGGDTVTPRGDKHDTGGVTQCQGEGDTVSPKPGIQPGIEPRAHRSSRTVPEDWTPNPLIERQARPQPGVDRDYELRQFRLHEFNSPRTDWDRAWAQWLNRATPRKPSYEDVRKQTVSYDESKHPAIVAERRLRQATKIGDM